MSEPQSFAKQEPEAAVPDKLTSKIVQSHTSQYTTYYLEKLAFFRKLADKLLLSDLWRQKLRDSRIQIHLSHQNDFTFTIPHSTINKEVVVLRARWGYFSMDITILNVNGENNRHGSKIGEGAFGVAYKATANDRQFILKCIPIREIKSRSHAIKEWFILKIASLAEFGPKLEPYLGFDMLMYSNCVEFPMEVCSSIFSVSSNMRLLEESLALMHRLRLVHMDIKPENIMLSPGHRKPVFIDFGLSRFVGQELGEKSLTRFYGSINFCSADMSSLFLLRNRSKEDWVDLYHNDLVSLEGSIQYIKSSASLYGFSQPEQYQAASLNELPNFIEFQLKYLLFKSQTDCFLQTWLRYIQKTPSQQSYCHNFFLHFLLELLPTDQLKRLFYALCADSDNESGLYSKVKLVYEMNRDNLYSLRQLQDEEKLACFSAYCDQYLIGDESSQSLQSRKASVAEMVLKPAAIRKVPFTEYALAYLEYMSYLQNRHRVSSAEREAAATVYAELFCPTDLKGRSLVLFTIKHLFEWALKASDLSQDYDTSAIILLRIYDFFTMLGLSSCQQMLRIVSRIYDCPRLSMLHRYLFVLRVKSSCSLYEYRLLRGKDSSVQTITALMRFYFMKIRNLDFILSKKQLYGTQFVMWSSKGIEDCNLGDDFMLEFGLQTMEYLMIESLNNEECYGMKMIELGNSLNIKTKHNGFYYFYCILFRVSYFRTSNLNMCCDVFKSLKENLQDQQILSEFIFELALSKMYWIIYGVIPSTFSYFEEVNSQLLRVRDKDLILLSDFIFSIFNIVKVGFNYPKLTTYLDHSQSFMVRFAKSSAAFYRQQFLSIKGEHSCIDAIMIFNLTTMTKSLAMQHNKSLFDFLSDLKFLENVNCHACKDIIHLNIWLNQLQEYLSQYFCPKNQYREGTSAQALINLFAESKKLQQYLKENRTITKTIFLRVTINALRFEQLVCCTNPVLEDKFHGIESYYHFAKKHNYICSYFRNESQNCFPVSITLGHFWRKDRQELIEFLHHLAKELQASLRASDYQILFIQCCELFCKLSQSDILDIFRKLKEYQKKRTVSSYLAIIYAILLNYAKNQSLINSITSSILSKIHKLHYRFQRNIFVRTTMKVIQQLGQKKDGSWQRKLQYCNNRLVRLLMIEECTLKKDSSINPARGTKQKALLKAKIARIGYFHQNSCRVQFKVIKRSRLTSSQR